MKWDYKRKLSFLSHFIILEREIMHIA
jgi:hypothetical protein